MQTRSLALLAAALISLVGVCCAAEPGVQPAAEPGAQPAEAQSPTANAPITGAAAASSAQGLPRVCLDAQSSDPLIMEFANRLRDTIQASGTLALASSTDACELKLHVPGNLLRFETAGGELISTVVIVTSASERYLSASITACQSTDLNPCAVRAVAAAKLALVLTPSNGGS